MKKLVYDRDGIRLYKVTRPDIRQVFTADKEMKCLFYTLVVRVEALRVKFRGGLRAFIERHRAWCNRELAFLFCMAAWYLDGAIDDLVENGVVPYEDFVWFDATDYTRAHKTDQEVEFNEDWLEGFLRDDGCLVVYFSS